MKKKEILLEAMTHEVLTALEHFSLIKINRTKINEIHWGKVSESFLYLTSITFCFILFFLLFSVNIQNII